MDGIPSERRGGSPRGRRRLREDQPSKAMTSGAISEFVHPSEHRFLSLRECARIQTFPDDFIFAGAISERILQIGDAVPPLLAKVIAMTLRDDVPVNRHSHSVDQGALLSFVSTASSGMSPTLHNACEMIESRLMHSYLRKEQ